MRVLLRVATLLVVLAGLQLFVFSERTDRWFAWTVQPSATAAFLGASYWSSATLEWTSSRQRSWAEARIAVPAVFVFTTLTLVVTLVHLERFHLGASFAGNTQAVTWAWIAIYSIVPVLMVVIWIVQVRTPGVDPPRHHPLPAGLLVLVAAQAAILLAFGLWLLLDPVGAGDWWPWPLTPLTGRAIGAWLVSLGVAAAQALVERDARRVRPAAVAEVTFALLQAAVLVRNPPPWDHAASIALVAALASLLVAGASALWVGRTSTLRADSIT